MITKLTPKQEKLIPVVRNEWLKIGLSTTPVDRAKVRKIFAELYAVAKKPTPKYIIHLDSPLHIAIAIAQLRLGDAQVRDQVSAQVSDQVSAQVSAQVRDLISWSWWYDFGQFDAGWLAWYAFMEKCGVDTSRLKPTFDAAKHCGWSILFWDWAFVSAKPSCIHRDEQGRLHCESGAAVHYEGFDVFAIHGVRVPEKVIIAPQSLTPAEIDAEKNAEVRRVMIERYGQDHYLMESNAKEIHRDEFGVLYRKEIAGDEALVMVKVVNSTPEPDGRFKDYFLRVPPTITRAREAVAWTFGKAEADYQPVAQS